jgi:hypothetical protein
MKLRSLSPLLLLGAILLIAGLTACDGSHNPVAPAAPTATASSQSSVSAEARSAAPTQPAKLNLSHIECVDGAVEIHFVLLFVPDGVTPGTLTYTYGTIEPGPHTGNVWHFTASGLPDGFYDVTGAMVTLSNGTVVTLHNPGDYAGEYDCTPNEACLTIDPEPILCFAPSDLGSPEAECAAFGLPALGKDDDLSGSTWIATQDAAMAIVKDGRGPCPMGENAYRTYIDVHAGDVLEKPQDAGDISHVTYCGCPPV